jgi:hypothetical protein
MTQKPCPEIVYPALPRHHFAILFEGAWVFTPDPIGRGILAICPIADDMHESEFGIWDNTFFCLSPVHGFDEIEVLRETAFTVTIDPDQIVNPEESFTSLFSKAAAVYPFIYLPSKDRAGAKDHPALKIRSSAIINGRTVSIPLPSSLRAAGALLTAEIGGSQKGRLFGHELVVKRAFTTFLFFYEYSESLKADVSRTRHGHQHNGSVAAEMGGSDPNPHLIFKVFPTNEGMAAMSSGMGTGHSGMLATGKPDQSMLKLHASTTFEVVRQSIPLATQPSVPCCDMALYHDQADMAFDCGDVGLSRRELGLEPCGEPIKGTKLPSCASGGVAVETLGTLED